MHDVLVIYKQLELRFDEDGNYIPFEADETVVHTISYDEKAWNTGDCMYIGRQSTNPWHGSERLLNTRDLVHYHYLQASTY